MVRPIGNARTVTESGTTRIFEILLDVAAVLVGEVGVEAAALLRLVPADAGADLDVVAEAEQHLAAGERPLNR